LQHQISHNRRESVVIIALFILVWLAIGVIVGLLFKSVVAGALLFGFLAVCGILYSYFLGGATVLAVSGAQKADPQQFAQLHNIVEAVAIGAGLPKPEVYVIDDPSPNAFATGRDPQHAAVTVTSGLLEMMNREELEGVIAHELSHIRNYDVRLVLIVVTLVAMAGLIGSLAIRASWGTGRGRDSQQIGLILIVVGVLLMLLGYIVGPLMQLALSRQREYLADASGVELTRNPAGLLSALKKLQANDHPLKTYNHATSAMFIDNPLEHHSHWFNHLYDTHPPIEDRIAALERILNVQQT
jgi:heat shock protein HtpX